MNKTIHGIHKSVSFTVFTWTPLRGLNSKQFHAFHNILDIESRATMSNGIYLCRIMEYISLSLALSLSLFSYMWIAMDRWKVRAFFGMVDSMLILILIRCKHVSNWMRGISNQPKSEAIRISKYFIHILMSRSLSHLNTWSNPYTLCVSAQNTNKMDIQIYHCFIWQFHCRLRPLMVVMVVVWCLA